MAIEQRLRVTQAVTTNGRTQRVDESGKVVTKVSILPVRAMEALNSINSRYEDALKMKIEVVNFDTKTQKVVSHNASEELDEPTTGKGKGRKKGSAQDIDELLGK